MTDTHKDPSMTLQKEMLATYFDELAHAGAASPTTTSPRPKDSATVKMSAPTSRAISA
jgi:hypothetical protein